MISAVSADEYYALFPDSSHCFTARPFLELNQHKVDTLLFLVSRGKRIGLAGGVKNGVFKSPFSAPLGGFHTETHLILPEELEEFIADFKEFSMQNGITEAVITIPPEFYAPTINGKAVNSFIRAGFSMDVPDLVSWIQFGHFDGSYHARFIKKNIRHAEREGLLFAETDLLTDKEKCYNLIKENRASRGWPIHITFADLLQTSEIIPIRFFKVTDPEGEMAASAIIYYSGTEFLHVIFWGDSEKGRHQRAMNFLVDNLWHLHQAEEFLIADIGTTTENGVPNNGLLHFKESHGCATSPRFTFRWSRA